MESAAELLQHHEQIRVATKYPRIAKDYFYNKKHQTVEIIKLNGSIELAPIVGLSEVICDIVETGTTLRENGLTVLEEVCPLSARVVVNQVSMKMENERITKLIRDLKKSFRRDIMRILKLTEDTRKDILQNLLKRSPNNYGEFEGRVNAIIEEVRNNRDQAVFNYTKQFDGADINAGNILVTEEEIAEAYEQVDTTLLAVIRKSLVNIKNIMKNRYRIPGLRQRTVSFLDRKLPHLRRLVSMFRAERPCILLPY